MVGKTLVALIVVLCLVGLGICLAQLLGNWDAVPARIGPAQNDLATTATEPTPIPPAIRSSASSEEGVRVILQDPDVAGLPDRSISCGALWFPGETVTVKIIGAEGIEITTLRCDPHSGTYQVLQSTGSLP